MATVSAPTTPITATPWPLPQPRLTLAEFLARYDGVPGAEFIDGVVKEQPVAGFKHGKICVKIAMLIGMHVEANDLGHVMSNDTWVRTEPGRVRGGDVLFVSYERHPKGDVPDGPLEVAPDLVVEVKSPSDRWIDLFAKVGEYLRAGVRVVLVLDPETRTASIYWPGDRQRILEHDAELTLPDVLPGFAVPVSRFFD